MLEFSLQTMATTTVTGTLQNGGDMAERGYREQVNVIVSGSRRRYFKLLCATALPALIVIVQNIINLDQDIKTFRKNLVVKENVQFSMEIGDILHELQSERGTSAFFVSTQGDEVYHDKLKEQYIQTDEAIINLSKWVSNNNVIRINSRQEFLDYLWDFRTSLLKEYVNLTEMISFYSKVNYLLESAMVRSMNMEVAYTYWSELIAYEMLLFSKEHASIERALGGTYYTRGKLPKQYYIWYVQTKRLSEEFLSQSVWYSTFAKNVVTSLYFESTLFDHLSRMREEITANTLRNTSLEAGNEWFEYMTAFIDILKTIQDGFASNINQHVSVENDSLEEKLAAKSVQLVVAISMLPIVCLLVRGIIKVSIELRNRTLDLESKKRQTDRLLIELEDERARTEELLHQVLPKSIAKTLIEKGHVVPEAFEDATIMFTDVVEFTMISSMCTPIEVISMLNKLYNTMDERVENYDVYKVETIGDAYMVTSGLPNRNDGKHVTEIAKLSLELRDALKKIMVPHRKNETVRLRIGFNTGPCAAGVVGHKMPKYCVFGDTVNTASRMESTSLPLMIQITESSASLLQESEGFYISERGHIEIKGKGLMRTFWLNSYQQENPVLTTTHLS